jgi:hypothetical protein
MAAGQLSHSRLGLLFGREGLVVITVPLPPRLRNPLLDVELERVVVIAQWKYRTSTVMRLDGSETSTTSV